MNAAKRLSTDSRVKSIFIVILYLFVGFSPATHAQLEGKAEPADNPTSTRVVFLGTGTPIPRPDRWGPAVAVIAGDKAYIVDAGVGVVRRAAAAGAKYEIDALSATRLDTLFMTHLHSDHTLGLPELLLTPWTMGRKMPLAIYGPRGSQEMASHVRNAFLADIDMRVDGLEPANDTGHHFDVTEIEAGEIYSDDNVTVEAIPVEHGSWESAYGYKFTTGERTIVISGDARPSESLIQASKGVDVLVHEVYSAVQFENRAPEWQRYHKISHTSTVELAEMAIRARPKLLVLYHQLDWGATHEEMIAEIRAAGYDGEVVSARDLDLY